MAEIRVSIAVDQVGAYGRNVLCGVAAYAHAHTRWQLSQDDSPALVNNVRAGRVAGVIAQVTTPEAERLLLRCRLSVVNVSNRVSRTALPRVVNDDAAIGRLVAEYFLARGFSRFAFVGLPLLHFSWLRGETFATEIRKRGFSCSTFNHMRRPAPFQPVAPWLASLPTPCAIMAADDYVGRQVINAAAEDGFRVPEDFAIVGVEDDRVCSAFCRVPLSSVQTGAEKVGFEAAHLLDRLLYGEPPPSGPVTVPPVQVITRHSSDVHAVEDPVVRSMLEHIREHAFGTLRAADVVRTVSLSRRMLEIRFQRALHRSIEQEIVRVRLDHAKRLLTETHLPISEVAVKSGFAQPRYLSVWFRKALQSTPVEYRRRFKME